MSSAFSWTSFHAKIHRIIRVRQLLEPNQRILVAVSGGQDSLCLIKLLLDLQSKWGWHLGIAHCDHRWRSDSQANAQHVANVARNWDTTFYLQTASEDLSINSEAKARNWRYQVLTDIARKNNYNCIVTGHTASDRAETLLYNLMRGSGADGLQALNWKRPLEGDIMLVRPLLEITRTQTGKFCQDLQLPVWEDSTNQDLKYARNQIRQELIPYLQKNFNPQVESALFQTAELLQAEVEYLEETARELQKQVIIRENIIRENSDIVQINRHILKNVPLALQRRVMRQILQQIMPHAPSFEHIEKLTSLIQAPNRSQTDPFPGGKIAKVEGDRIIFEF
ncbi:tRNA lysidine(34) synthetase TilS [Mastigocoleus sp. MO_188.B34]|uniref:tRNA lysidine(34) synthetase TilS n=1 Tax=Mastigocoleus sp. MO_188.B34 TaxID=3036635 RepID=UPI002628AA64|nr:tRNA lysidine(34) synthetase TilS [Mastigocoleus sp. MO_188.B34]MDJ0696629.1 tRNA lysidine(34) synthetase TilS [Mastigocoleus sp. MO_188.B34]